MATMFAIVMAAAATTAVFAAVGAGIAAATGHDSAAKTFGSIALVSFQIALAAAGGMDICNMLAMPSPSIYSDVLTLDSEALSKTTGYREITEALQGQIRLGAGDGSLYSYKEIARTAASLNKTLHVSGPAAEVIGAKITSVHIAHQELLGTGSDGMFRFDLSSQYGTYVNGTGRTKEIYNVVTGMETKMWRIGKSDSEFALGMDSGWGLNVSFRNTSYRIGGAPLGHVISRTDSVMGPLGQYGAHKTSVYINFDSFRDIVHTFEYSPRIRVHWVPVDWPQPVPIP